MGRRKAGFVGFMELGSCLVAGTGVGAAQLKGGGAVKGEPAPSLRRDGCGGPGVPTAAAPLHICRPNGDDLASLQKFFFRCKTV
jgi:hypothetical protein